MSDDINAVVERGRKRYGAAEFDAASQVAIDAIPDPSARAQFVAAIARNAEGEDLVWRRANELRARTMGREGPKSDEREARIAKINVKSAMYDGVSDADWHAAFSKTYGEKARKRR
jgi:hypothetical protein